MSVALTGISTNSREKAMFIVNLVGVLLGFIVVGITSNGAVTIIKTSNFISFLFFLAILFLLLSFLSGLVVSTELFSIAFPEFILVFNSVQLLFFSFLFLLLGLISVVLFVILLVFGFGIYFDTALGVTFLCIWLFSYYFVDFQNMPRAKKPWWQFR